MRVRVKITGISPLLMHNPRMVDPEYEVNRELKLVAAKRKKTDDDYDIMKKLEWYGGIYTDEIGESHAVVQPSSKIRKSFIEAARIHKMGKQVERGVSFVSLNIPLIYDGPRDIDDLYKDKKYISRLSVVVNGKRIMRTRPSFPPGWALETECFLLEDVMNFSDLKVAAELAGLAIGIGDNRVNGYGRYNSELTLLEE